MLFTWPYVVGLEFLVLYLFSIHRFAWRYISLKEAKRVLWATLTAAVPLLIARFVSGAFMPEHMEFQYAFIPVGVILANVGLSFFGIVGVRAVRRMSAERESAQKLARAAEEMVPTLLIGAGQGGDQVARELEKRPDLGIEPVGFLDDDHGKIGSTVRGIPVLGTIDELPKIAARMGAKQVIVTIADLEPKVLRRIVERCEKERLKAKILPGLYQLIDGQAGLGRLRDVSIEDLLGRDAVKLDLELIGAFLTGKRVLVTGAGGSIGSELCRQVAAFAPETLTLVERSEFALFTIHQELLKHFPNVTMIPRICDIGDLSRLDTVFAEDRPQVVFHAAAHKHVPMMEYNPGEAIKNNVFGTKAVADAADRHGADAFVMISTDKAVNPTSIMGATKRVAEMYVQALSTRSRTKYVAVRFGNVLGSTGSVIPTFKAQIAAGGPVTVTHPEMVRYFMTIPEASQLVMQAAAMGKGGEIFVLDMGEPVKIVDLAHDLIRLSGLVPGVDVQIEFTGMRPGEKLFEELGFDAERMSKTAHPKIFIGRLAPLPLGAIEGSLSHLREFTGSTSAKAVRDALRVVVTEMLPDQAESVAQPKRRAVSAVDAPASRPPLVELASSPVR
ncbi:MAG: nucleoside-diphosphate sugar epimerase/dehydratase [Polyangiaceae bacterium]